MLFFKDVKTFAERQFDDQINKQTGAPVHVNFFLFPDVFYNDKASFLFSCRAVLPKKWTEVEMYFLLIPGKLIVQKASAIYPQKSFHHSPKNNHK